MSFFYSKKFFFDIYIYIPIAKINIFGINILICFMFFKTYMLKVWIVYFCKYDLEKHSDENKKNNNK